MRRKMAISRLTVLKIADQIADTSSFGVMARRVSGRKQHRQRSDANAAEIDASGDHLEKNRLYLASRLHASRGRRNYPDSLSAGRFESRDWRGNRPGSNRLYEGPESEDPAPFAGMGVRSTHNRAENGDRSGRTRAERPLSFAILDGHSACIGSPSFPPIRRTYTPSWPRRFVLFPRAIAMRTEPHLAVFDGAAVSFRFRCHSYSIERLDSGN